MIITAQANRVAIPVGVKLLIPDGIYIQRIGLRLQMKLTLNSVMTFYRYKAVNHLALMYTHIYRH